MLERSAHGVCERLLLLEILSKDSQESVARFAPPLVITRDQIDWAIPYVAAALAETRRADAA